MRNGPSRRIRLSTLLSLAILSLVLTGCFQSAGEAIQPTPVSLPTLTTLPLESPTPFVTPLSTGGFATPTENLNLAMTLTALANQPPAETPTTGAVAPAADTSETAAPPVAPPEVTLTPAGPEATTAAPIPPTAALLATPTALPTEGSCVHTVQPGEWLYAIARKYNINPEDLKAANPQFAGRYDTLQPGDVLNIPNCNQAPTAVPPTPAPANPAGAPTSGAGAVAPTSTMEIVRVYTVAAGDTLGSIARKFNTTVQAIREANGLTSDALAIGQQLNIPKPQ